MGQSSIALESNRDGRFGQLRSVILRLASDLGLPSDAAEERLGRALAILDRVGGEGEVVPVDEGDDQVLRTCLLFSARFEQFCLERYGRLIDRIPSDRDAAGATYAPGAGEPPRAPATRSEPELREAVMGYPLEGVLSEYRRREGVSSALARAHERELRRYLTLCMLDPEAGFGMTGPVDELWHTFVQDTQAYRGFCESTLGHMLHHEPPQEGRATAGSYEAMLVAYEARFSETAPRDHWPRLPDPARSEHPPDPPPDPTPDPPPDPPPPPPPSCSGVCGIRG